MNQSHKGRAPLFPVGACVATPGALDAMQGDRDLAHMLIARHMYGDWGDVCADDAAANESALRHGSRLMSVYRLVGGETLWLITEADRSVTTLLTPDEY